MADRKQALINAGKARAAISSFFANNSDTQWTVEDVYANTDAVMREIGYDYHQVRNILNAMIDNGTLTKEKEGRSVFYCMVEPVTTVKRVKRTKQSDTTLQPDVKLDFVKGTNRVRITMGGLVIEMGVVDK